MVVLVSLMVALQATRVNPTRTQGVARRLPVPWAEESRACGAGLPVPARHDSPNGRLVARAASVGPKARNPSAQGTASRRATPWVEVSEVLRPNGERYNQSF
jgi:hypothetical protein